MSNRELPRDEALNSDTPQTEVPIHAVTHAMAPAAKPSVGRVVRFYFFGFVVLAAASAAVAYFHVTRSKEIATVREAKATVADLGPRVEVVTTAAGPKERIIKLLGDVRSGASTSLYGKVSGYMKTMHVDKGDKVEAGQIVAEIESPELDQQYAAASAEE